MLYLHSANIMHRDIKPSNILMNMNCDLKICDFGLSRGMYQVDNIDARCTKYVVTRWYRAPEVTLNTQSYTEIVDLWSVGCVFAELLGRKPIFPGQNQTDQITTIISTMGALADEDMAGVDNMHARNFLFQV